jgi:hypothetical protein
MYVCMYVCVCVCIGKQHFCWDMCRAAVQTCIGIFWNEVIFVYVCMYVGVNKHGGLVILQLCSHVMECFGMG